MALPLSHPLPFSAYLLAGGKSRRFGCDKARALWKGRPFLVYQQALLQRCFDEVQVIARSSQAYQDLGIAQALVDIYPDCGPLGGLHRALQDQQERGLTAEWVFLASCDTFGVSVAQIHTLAEQLQRDAQAQAVIWETAHGPEPLWGFYHRQVLAQVEQALQQGDYALQSLLRTLPVQRLGLSVPWIQVNCPEDLRKVF